MANKKSKLSRQRKKPDYCQNCPMWHDSHTEDCDDCVEGRWIGAVSEYASTCDGCGELTSHELLAMDMKTQLGYCEKCRPDAWVDGEKQNINDLDNSENPMETCQT